LMEWLKKSVYYSELSTSSKLWSQHQRTPVSPFISGCSPFATVLG
jgi:hypothetical protein